jgi:hypothetical protein
MARTPARIDDVLPCGTHDALLRVLTQTAETAP